MNKGNQVYETAIHKFLGNSVIKRLEEIHFKNDEEVRQRLLPDTSDRNKVEVVDHFWLNSSKNRDRAIDERYRNRCFAHC